MTREQLLKKVRQSTSSTSVFFTQSGHKLSLQEHKFINNFIVNGDTATAAKEAGYIPNPKKPKETFASIGNKVLSRDYIYEEILFRLEEIEQESLADATEVMQYFTRVMRGEEKDQFGLDAPLSERTSAAKELARRLIDVPNKANESDKAIKIELDWKRD